MEKKNKVKSGKRGLWAMLKESMNKASSGCGPGCGCRVEKNSNKNRQQDTLNKPANDKEQG